MLDDIIRDTWFYKDILKQGLEEGLEKGRVEGLEKGRVEGLEKGKQEGLRVAILDIIQDRFPNVAEFAKKQVESIKDAAVLRQLIVEMSVAQSAEEAKRYIEELGKEKA